MTKKEIAKIKKVHGYGYGPFLAEELTKRGVTTPWGKKIDSRYIHEYFQGFRPWRPDLDMEILKITSEVSEKKKKQAEERKQLALKL